MLFHSLYVFACLCTSAHIYAYSRSFLHACAHLHLSPISVHLVAFVFAFVCNFPYSSVLVCLRCPPHVRTWRLYFRSSRTHLHRFALRVVRAIWSLLLCAFTFQHFAALRELHRCVFGIQVLLGMGTGTCTHSVLCTLVPARFSLFRLVLDCLYLF
ncbi:hypothetical protein F4604DRAFT_1735143 [Suillus subluteus]|nr:hypothetical protein F4604DRAFT_1735143 [Suillus subluteus]